MKWLVKPAWNVSLDPMGPSFVDVLTRWMTGVEVPHSPVEPLSHQPLNIGIPIIGKTARCSGGISDARFS